MSYNADAELLDSPFLSVYYETDGDTRAHSSNTGNFYTHTSYVSGANCPDDRSHTVGYKVGYANSGLLLSSAANKGSGVQLPESIGGLFFGTSYSRKPGFFTDNGRTNTSSYSNRCKIINYYWGFSSRLHGQDPDAADTTIRNRATGNSVYGARPFVSDGVNTGQYLKGGQVKYDPVSFRSSSGGQSVTYDDNTLSGMLTA